MKKKTPRLLYFYALLSVIVLLVVASYLEFWKGIVPCPLCILQRITLLILGIIFLCGTLFTFKKRAYLMLGVTTCLFSSVGIYLSGRQVWLQHLPANQSADCGVSLQYMLRVLPLDEVLRKIFVGTAECSLVDWSFLDFSLAQWSFIWFILFALFSLWQIIRS